MCLGLLSGAGQQPHPLPNDESLSVRSDQLACRRYANARRTDEALVVVDLEPHELRR
ncbi:MAG: hypothetical protein JWO86_554 [Myxococcaceae bacterium]|nr:hypothetical protein [Myxococcaceae bacterium]